jgi:hypothetical protein
MPRKKKVGGLHRFSMESPRSGGGMLPRTVKVRKTGAGKRKKTSAASY